MAGQALVYPVVVMALMAEFFFLQGSRIGHQQLIPTILAMPGHLAGDHQGFTIRGSVDGISPGSTGHLTLTVGNPGGSPLRVTSLDATAGSADPGCGVGELHVTPWSGSILVPAHRSAAQTLDVQLSVSPPQACDGTSFPLSYSDSASPA
jgi:hypothetical protein